MASGGTCSFGAALAATSDTKLAVLRTCDEARKTLDGDPDVAILFASPHHRPDLEAAIEDLTHRLGGPITFGCTGEAIIGVGREMENIPAFSLWLACMPGITIEPIRLTFEPSTGEGNFFGWPDSLLEGWPKGGSLLLLADPFSFPADALIHQLNREQPGFPIVGGMVSGGTAPGQNRMILGTSIHARGAVGLMFSGPIAIETVVSQGCRPIGKPFVVTKAQDNVLFELGGMPAIDQLQKVLRDLTDHDKAVLERSRGIHIGRVIDEYKEHFGRGDFLIRNILQADPESGAIAVADFIRPGQTVQFQLRDHETAHEDLRELLQGHRTRMEGGNPPAAGLLFSCNGRGTRLFPEKDHDAGLFRAVFGDLPLAGFFAQGEIGPVGKRNFLHGFTASLALIRPIPA